MKKLKDKRRFLITGVKGGIGKTYTCYLLADYFSRVRNMLTVIINCDAKHNHLTEVYKGKPNIEVFNIPMEKNNDVYGMILEGVNNYPDAAVIIDTPGQTTNSMELPFAIAWVTEEEGSILWVTGKDPSCIDVLKTAHEQNMPCPVIVIQKVAMEEMRVWLNSDIRKKYGISTKNELYIPEMPSSLWGKLFWSEDKSARITLREIIEDENKSYNMMYRLSAKQYTETFKGILECVEVPKIRIQEL